MKKVFTFSKPQPQNSSRWFSTDLPFGATYSPLTAYIRLVCSLGDGRKQKAHSKQPEKAPQAHAVFTGRCSQKAPAQKYEHDLQVGEWRADAERRESPKALRPLQNSGQ